MMSHSHIHVGENWVVFPIRVLCCHGGSGVLILCFLENSHNFNWFDWSITSSGFILEDQSPFNHDHAALRIKKCIWSKILKILTPGCTLVGMPSDMNTASQCWYTWGESVEKIIEDTLAFVHTPLDSHIRSLFPSSSCLILPLLNQLLLCRLFGLSLRFSDCMLHSLLYRSFLLGSFLHFGCCFLGLCWLSLLVLILGFHLTLCCCSSWGLPTLCEANQFFRAMEWKCAIQWE